MRGQILYRSNCMWQLRIKGKSTPNDAWKDGEMTPNDKGQWRLKVGRHWNEMMGNVMQGYARAMLWKSIQVICQYCSATDLANKNVPRTLRVSLNREKTAVEEERENVMNSDLKGETANAAHYLIILRSLLEDYGRTKKLLFGATR